MDRLLDVTKLQVLAREDYQLVISRLEQENAQVVYMLVAFIVGALLWIVCFFKKDKGSDLFIKSAFFGIGVALAISLLVGVMSGVLSVFFSGGLIICIVLLLSALFGRSIKEVVVGFLFFGTLLSGVIFTVLFRENLEKIAFAKEMVAEERLPQQRQSGSKFQIEEVVKWQGGIDREVNERVRHFILEERKRANEKSKDDIFKVSFCFNLREEISVNSDRLISGSLNLYKVVDCLKSDLRG